MSKVRSSTTFKFHALYSSALVIKPIKLAFFHTACYWMAPPLLKLKCRILLLMYSWLNAFTATTALPYCSLTARVHDVFHHKATPISYIDNKYQKLNGSRIC